MKSMELKQLAVLFIVILTSGCMSIQTDAHVNSEGEIETIEQELGIEQSLYEEFDEEGSEELEEEFTRDIRENGAEYFEFEEFEVTETTNSDENKDYIEIKFDGIDLNEDAPVSVYTENGEVVYEDEDGSLIEGALPEQEDDFETGGAGLDTEQESEFDSDFGPYCLGPTDFYFDDVSVSNYEVVDDDLVLGVENLADSEVQVESLQIEGQQVEVQEQLDLFETSSVTIDDVNPVEQDECQTYDVEVDYTQNGEENTASGELETSYSFSLTQLASANQDSDTMTLASHNTGDQDLDFEEEPGFGDADEDFEAFEESMMAGMEEVIDMDYRVHMPGEVIETTGEEIEDDTVEYGFSQLADIAVEEEEQVYVRSEAEDENVLGRISSWFSDIL